MFRPTAYEHVQTIAANMREGRICIVDFQNAETQIREQMLQFLYGICYFQGVQPEMANENIFMFDPEHRTPPRRAEEPAEEAAHT